MMIKTTILLVIAFLSESSLADNAVDHVFEQGDRFRQKQLSHRNVETRRYIRNETVTSPINVKGRNSTTVIQGSTFINNGTVENMFLKVYCPAYGGRVIVRNNRLINRGRIIGRDSTVGLMVSDCRGNSSFYSMGNTFDNSGQIIGE